MRLLPRRAAQAAGNTWLLLGVWILILSVGASTLDDEQDALWMAREGLDVLRGSAFVHPDHWSWAPAPNEFIPSSPGWNVLLGIAWSAAGQAGIFALTVVSNVVALSVMAWAAHRVGAGAVPTVAALTVAIVVALPLFGSRASLASISVLLAECVAASTMLARSHRSTVARTFVLTLASAGIGIWVHGSWALLAPAAALAVTWLAFTTVGLEPLQRGAVSLAGASGSTLGVLAGPLGMHTWSHAVQVADVCRGVVLEWMTPWQLGGGAQVQWSLSLAAGAGLAAWAFRQRREAGGPLLTVLGLACFAFMVAGAGAIRFLLLGTVFGVPVLAAVLARGLPDGALRRRLGERAGSDYWRVALSLACVPMGLTAALGVLEYPWGPDPALASLPNGCRLFSSDRAAKSVPLYRPDVSVWFDGRQDYWGRERILEANAYVTVRDPSRLVPTGSTCVMMENRPELAIVSALDASRDWRRVSTTASLIAWVPRG